MEGIRINNELLNTVTEALLEISDDEFAVMELIISQVKEQRDFVKSRNVNLIGDKANKAKEMLRELIGDRK